MNIKHICILFGITAWVNFAPAASTPEDCAAITDDAKRLACYDQFLKNRQAPAKPEPAAQPTEPAKPAMSEQAQKATTQIDVAAKKDKVDEFGREQVNREEKLESISSTAVGTYSKWVKGLEVTLENGQVWEVVSPRMVYHKTTNPIVVIEKGLMDNYLMSVKGSNSKIRVKRIK